MVQSPRPIVVKTIVMAYNMVPVLRLAGINGLVYNGPHAITQNSAHQIIIRLWYMHTDSIL